MIRGGYGRTYGRLNGVDLVLVPLLGTGLIQPVQCIGATVAMALAAAPTPANGFPHWHRRPDGSAAAPLAQLCLSRSIPA